MPKNQKNVRTKKYRRDRNHAEFLEAIEFFNILRTSEKILGYAYPAEATHEKRIALTVAKQNRHTMTVQSMRIQSMHFYPKTKIHTLNSQ